MDSSLDHLNFDLLNDFNKVITFKISDNLKEVQDFMEIKVSGHQNLRLGANLGLEHKYYKLG